MAEIERSALLMYSAEEMFSLVNDIESYPEFLPWCQGAQVFEKADAELQGKIDIKKGPIELSFTTHNQMKAPEHIAMRLLQGHFKRLEGQWAFLHLADSACKVSLTLDYEWRPGLDQALATWVSSAADKVLQSFSERAKVLYGAR